MGWSYGVNAHGREVGYSVEATCDHDGCDTKIDRGLAYCCGGMHDGGEYGCGGYFCDEHMRYASPSEAVCLECAERFCPVCCGEDEPRPVHVFTADGSRRPEACDSAWHDRGQR